MPVEWTAHRRTWMCWPCRIEAWGTLAPAKRAFADVARAIRAFEPVTMAVRPEDAAEASAMLGAAAEVFECPLDDSWARDTGPTFLRGQDGLAAVGWRFNAWGEKYAPYDKDAALASRIAERAGARFFPSPLVCEGGAIHSDGAGTLIATTQTLLNPNRNPGRDRAEVEALLCATLGAERLVWLGDGFSDVETDGHVDNIACFVAPGRALVGVPASRAHPDWPPVRDATRALRSAGIEIVEIEQPRTERRDWRGRPLAASYVNFAFANGGIVVPAFDDPSDDAAVRLLRDCFPDRKVVPVDARAIVEGGGGIHCITCQEPSL